MLQGSTVSVHGTNDITLGSHEQKRRSRSLCIQLFQLFLHLLSLLSWTGSLHIDDLEKVMSRSCQIKGLNIEMVSNKSNKLSPSRSQKAKSRSQDWRMTLDISERLWFNRFRFGFVSVFIMILFFVSWSRLRLPTSTRSLLTPICCSISWRHGYGSTGNPKVTTFDSSNGHPVVIHHPLSFSFRVTEVSSFISARLKRTSSAWMKMLHAISCYLFSEV